MYYSQHISHAAAGDERAMNEPLPDTSINSVGGGGQWKTSHSAAAAPFGGGIWSSNSGSSLNNASWPKETTENQNWMHGGAAGGAQPGTMPTAGEDMQMRWGRGEVNQQTPWNVEPGLAPSSGSFDTQWPLSGRKPQQQQHPQQMGMGMGQRRFENGRREEGGDPFFHQQMLYGDDPSFYTMNGNGFQSSALSPHHPSQQSSWAMQNAEMFTGSQSQQPAPYAGNAWMQQCQQTPPPAIHGDVGSSGAATQRMMPVPTQIPPPSMGGGAQKYHAQPFAPQQFPPLGDGEGRGGSNYGPPSLQSANNAQQFNPSYSSQQQQQHQLFTGSEDPVWRDPNSALRRWQEQTGTTTWDKPGAQSKPIRLWKEHSDDGPYLERIASSREQSLQPQQVVNGEGGWGELPTIDEEKFKHHHVCFESTSSSAYGAPSATAHRSGGGGGYQHLPNHGQPQNHSHPHQHSQQFQHAEYHPGGGIGRQYHPPTEGHFTPTYHLDGGGVAPPPMRHHHAMSMRPDSVAPHQKWTAQAPPLYAQMDRASAERMPLFDLAMAGSGMMGAPPLAQINPRQHQSAAPFKQRQFGGSAIGGGYPRDEGAMWGSDMGLQSMQPPHYQQQQAHMTARGMGAEPVKVRNLVEELSFIPAGPSDVDRGELGPAWAGLPTQHSTLMNPSASSAAADSYPPIMP